MDSAHGSEAVVSALLCLSPILLLAIATAAAGLYVYRRNTRRVEFLRATVAGIGKVELAETDDVARSVPEGGASIARVLVEGAQLLRRLAEGDALPLEKHRLDGVVRALDQYTRQAPLGHMPTTELRELRESDVQQVHWLASVLSDFTRSAEKGDVASARKYLLLANTRYVEVYQGHSKFRGVLAAHGISQFPVAPSAPARVRLDAHAAEHQYLQIVAQLPEDRRMLFMMQYNNARKNPTTAVLLAILFGGIGAHRFYMGQIGWGMVYVLFSWTWIPMIVGLAEAFTISGQVHSYNAQKAAEISMMLMPGHK